MTGAGFQFGQATIWKIEKGQREVKIAEAVALGKALGDGPQWSWLSLLRPPFYARAEQAGIDAAARLVRAEIAIREATKTYLDAIDNTELAVNTLVRMGVDETREELRESLGLAPTRDSTPELIAAYAHLDRLLERLAAPHGADYLHFIARVQAEYQAIWERVSADLVDVQRESAEQPVNWANWAVPHPDRGESQ
jgi:hypothetical protein